jgi:DNA-binding beta-propeller fold protein YncE
VHYGDGSIVFINPNSATQMLLFAQFHFVVVIIVTKMFPVVNWNKQQKQTNFMMQQTSKTNFDIKSINDNKPLFSSERYLEHYDNNRNENLDLSLIAEEIIDYIMMPLIDAKVLHYLKCMNYQWKTKIEKYAEKSVPMFEFIAKFGTKGSENGQFNSPWFVANDKQGNIYVSDCGNNRIQVFDSNGQWLKSIGSYGSGNGQFKGPTGIAFNFKNHMFVAGSGNNRIVQFDENMQFIKAFGSEGNENGQFQIPSGIAIDTDDNIVVADNANHRIQKFSKDGNWKQIIGKYGSGDGGFYYPWDVAVCKTSGRIFVSDECNHRIQVFSSDGKFLF